MTFQVGVGKELIAEQLPNSDEYAALQGEFD